MERTYFARAEAKEKVGSQVKARQDFPSVPAGTVGDVVGTNKYSGGKYLVRVKWKVRRPSWLIDASMGGGSLHWIGRRKAVVDELCLSEFETIVDEV